MQEKQNAKSLKVLIVSENASREFGGEAILPLNYFMMLTEKNIDCYLITHERVKASLQLITELNQSKIFYIRDTKFITRLIRTRVFLSERIWQVTFGLLHYLIEQFQLWNMARFVVKNKNISVVHQPIPVSPKYPSLMFGLKAPVVIGPMNGGMHFPKAFNGMASPVERYLFLILRSLSTLMNVILPGKLFAKLLLVANQRTADALPLFRFGQVKTLVENGVISTRLAPKVSDKRGLTEKIKIIFVGRMVDWKAIDILIDAFHQTKLANLELMLIGDGVERPKLEQKVKELNAKNITFYGSIPFSQMNQYYDESDIFVLPSIRECGGAVVLEAMSSGLPVIATNWGGPADYLTPETGILIEPLSREYMVTEFAKQIALLSNNKELRQRLGYAAALRVKNNFLWENKINQMIELYQSVI